MQRHNLQEWDTTVSMKLDLEHWMLTLIKMQQLRHSGRAVVRIADWTAETPFNQRFCPVLRRPWQPGSC
jgi:hypothetical protein